MRPVCAATGDHFRRFKFLTNHPLHAAENGASLPFVLQECRNTTSAASVPSTVLTFLKQIAKAASCSVEVAFAALAKTDASDALPKLADAKTRLVNDLVLVWAQAQHSATGAVIRVADRLVEVCGQASSLAHQDLLPTYVPMTANPAKAEVAALIEGKRITKARLLEILDQGLNQTALLHGDPSSVVPPGSGSADLLRAKLNAGGFSMPSINAADDLRDKADYLSISWTKKHGNGPGLQQYDHVRSVVLTEGASAFEATKAADPFGLNMLSLLRSRFQQRRKDGTHFYDCSDDHLEGFAYALTAQCKLQWSQERPWEKKK